MRYGVRSKPRRLLASTLAGAALLFASAASHAVIISSQTGSTPSASVAYYGQGVATPDAGVSWNNIRFSFDSASGAPTTNYAEGDLFLLSGAYSGTPEALSSTTSGFIAQSTGIVGGQWTFDSSVVLASATTYYFFMGDRPAASATRIYGLFDSSSPGLFSASCSSCSYLGNTNDFDYSLEGDVLAVPEPGTAAILGLGLAALGLRRRRR